MIKLKKKKRKKEYLRFQSKRAQLHIASGWRGTTKKGVKLLSIAFKTLVLRAISVKQSQG